MRCSSSMASVPASMAISAVITPSRTSPKRPGALPRTSYALQHMRPTVPPRHRARACSLASMPPSLSRSLLRVRMQRMSHAPMSLSRYTHVSLSLHPCLSLATPMSLSRYTHVSLSLHRCSGHLDVCDQSWRDSYSRHLSQRYAISHVIIYRYVYRL